MLRAGLRLPRARALTGALFAAFLLTGAAESKRRSEKDRADAALAEAEDLRPLLGARMGDLRVLSEGYWAEEDPGPELLERREELRAEIKDLLRRFRKKRKKFVTGRSQRNLEGIAHAAFASREDGESDALGRSLSETFYSSQFSAESKRFVDEVRGALASDEEAFEGARRRREELRSRWRAWTVGGASVAGAAVLIGLLLLLRRRRARVKALLPEPARTALPSAEPPLLGGRYRVTAEVGRCGLGRLLQAEGPEGKVLLELLDAIPGVDGGGEFAAALGRFRGVAHENLAELLAVVQDGGGVCLALRHVSGRTLRSALDSVGRVKLADARNCLGQAARGVAHLHAKGLVHGGLTPDSLLLGGGRVTVLEAGVAAAARSCRPKGSWGGAAGSPAYTAPEQELGPPRPESDVFSLGVILYEMLGGVVPFTGPNFPAQKREGLFRPLGGALPGTPPAVDALVRAALQPEPGRRPRSAAEFLAALGV